MKQCIQCSKDYLQGKNRSKLCSTECRYWAKIDIKGIDECWLWIASKLHDGYGAFGIAGKPIRAHRYGYELVNGAIPDGLVVMHSCDIPLCQNPKHLKAATILENNMDCFKKQRNPTAKLTEDQVKNILLDYRPNQEIALDYGVDGRCISDIKIGKSWKRIEGKRGRVKKKLSAEQIINIRADNRLHIEIAKDYNIGRSAISNIKCGHRGGPL